MNNNVVVLALACFIAACFTTMAKAANCGTIGTTFPITETDMRDLVQARLATLQANGQLAHLQSQVDAALSQGMQAPAPVAGLMRTIVAKTTLFDPTVHYAHDIINADGQVVLPAGTAYNPLDTITLGEALLFYDATDPDQAAWAVKTDQALNGQDKLILVNGALAPERQRFHKPVYFDQGGRLAARFHLQHVPVLVQQAGNKLSIQEVVP